MDDVTDPDSFNDDAEFGEDDMDGTEPLLSGQQVRLCMCGVVGGWEVDIERGREGERNRGREEDREKERERYREWGEDRGQRREEGRKWREWERSKQF